MRAAIKIMTGIRDEFEEVVRREGRKVYNLAFRLCGNAEEAKDIAQETFVKAYECAGRFRGESQVFTWLYRIACNIWKNRLRYTVRHPVAPLESADPDGCAYDPPSPDPSPGVSFERGERTTLVRACVEALEPDDRLLIVLREMEDRSYEEMARILGWPLGTVKSRLARARENLRLKLIPHMERLRQ